MSYVKAPSSVQGMEKMGRYGCFQGPWAIEYSRGAYECAYYGVHQNVPFATTGRTPGRALRAMRRALARLSIPVSE